MAKRDIEARPIHNVFLWPADTGISYGFGMLNDAQAALTLVSLRTHTKIKSY